MFLSSCFALSDKSSRINFCVPLCSSGPDSPSLATIGGCLDKRTSSSILWSMSVWSTSTGWPGREDPGGARGTPEDPAEEGARWKTQG